MIFWPVCKCFVCNEKSDAYVIYDLYEHEKRYYHFDCLTKVMRKLNDHDVDMLDSALVDCVIDTLCIIKDEQKKRVDEIATRYKKITEVNEWFGLKNFDRGDIL